jgi:tRNA pseudouridine38-40 synthase
LIQWKIKKLEIINESASQRIVLGIEYDGSTFHGWQSQSHASSVQQSLETALSEVANHPVRVFCAGRTDTGVHATYQVIHFDSFTQRPEKAWLKGANSLLPDQISIRFVVKVDNDFHARFSALERSYLYVIDNNRVKPAILNNGLTWYRNNLDISKMNDAANYFIGEHDFSSFRSSQCQSKTAVRNIQLLSCSRNNDYVFIKVTANAFLHHMVRNIAGVLLEIGSGKKLSSWAKSVIDAKDRTVGGVTARPNGLYLVDVKYPSNYIIPQASKKLLWMNN